MKKLVGLVMAVMVVAGSVAIFAGCGHKSYEATIKYPKKTVVTLANGKHTQKTDEYTVTAKNNKVTFKTSEDGTYNVKLHDKAKGDFKVKITCKDFDVKVKDSIHDRSNMLVSYEARY